MLSISLLFGLLARGFLEFNIAQFETSQLMILRRTS